MCPAPLEYRTQGSIRDSPWDGKRRKHAAIECQARLALICVAMEKEAAEYGLCFSAAQNAWGVEARPAEGEKGVYELRDCDGEVWATGTVVELTDKAMRDRLLADIRGFSPVNDDEED